MTNVKVCNEERMKDLMEEAALDAVIAHSRINVGYLSGFFRGLWSWENECWHAFYVEADGADCFLIGGMRRDGEYFWSLPPGWSNRKAFKGDAEYHIEYMREYSVESKTLLGESGLDATTVVDCLAEVIDELELGGGRIGLEMMHLPVGVFEDLKKKLPEATFLDAESVFNRCRMVKTPEELRRQKRAAEIAAESHVRLSHLLGSGPALYDCLKEIHSTALDNHGVFQWAHVSWWGTQEKDYRIQKGDIGGFDIGICYEGYVSDMARTYVVGPVPADVRRRHDISVELRKKLLEATRPGTSVSEVGRLNEDFERENGLNHSRMGGGHGIGIEVHEPPFIRSEDQTILEPGMVLAFEHFHGLLDGKERPPGWVTGAIHIEDMGFLTENGVQLFSDLETELFVVP